MLTRPLLPIRAQANLKESLGFMVHEDAELVDLGWFAAHFPTTLQLKHILAAYKVLEANMKA